MNLPHQKPIKFVQEIIERQDQYNIVSCLFPSIPTLAMVCEAAAQSSASFSQSTEEEKIGFLVSLKNIELLKTLESLEYEIKIEKSFTFGIMSEFKFKLINNLNVYVEGTFAIALPDETNS